MAKKQQGSTLGSWAFLIGVIIAVIFAFLQITNWLIWVLFVIGVIIGLFNITDKEATPFLMAGTVLVVVSYLGSGVVEELGVRWIPNFLTNLLTIFVPATIIVALRAVFAMAKE